MSQLLTEDIRASKGDSLIDIDTDSAQFVDEEVALDDDACLDCYGISDSDFPGDSKGIFVIHPEDKLFKGQTEPFYCYFTATMLRQRKYGIGLYTDDPKYKGKLFIPTQNDLVRILLKCTDNSKYNVKLLHKFRDNFSNVFTNSDVVRKRFVYEDDQPIRVSLLPDPSYNYAKEMKSLFGTLGDGIPTDDHVFPYHGINKSSHADRYGILKSLVKQNGGDFGKVICTYIGNKDNSFGQSRKLINKVLTGGIAICLSPKIRGTHPKDLDKHIVDVIFYAPFDLLLYCFVCGVKEISRQVLETAWQNLANGYCMTDH